MPSAARQRPSFLSSNFRLRLHFIIINNNTITTLISPHPFLFSDLTQYSSQGGCSPSRQCQGLHSVWCRNLTSLLPSLGCVGLNSKRIYSLLHLFLLFVSEQNTESRLLSAVFGWLGEDLGVSEHVCCVQSTEKIWFL